MIATDISSITHVSHISLDIFEETALRLIFTTVGPEIKMTRSILSTVASTQQEGISIRVDNIDKVGIRFVQFGSSRLTLEVRISRVETTDTTNFTSSNAYLQRQRNRSVIVYKSSSLIVSVIVLVTADI